MNRDHQFRFDIRSKHREFQISSVREAVEEYVRFAPNQGGDESPRELIRSAFHIVRSHVARGCGIQSACGELWSIANSYSDM